MGFIQHGGHVREAGLWGPRGIGGSEAAGREAQPPDPLAVLEDRLVQVVPLPAFRVEAVLGEELPAFQVITWFERSNGH